MNLFPSASIPGNLPDILVESKWCPLASFLITGLVMVGYGSVTPGLAL